MGQAFEGLTGTETNLDAKGRAVPVFPITPSIRNAYSWIKSKLKSYRCSDGSRLECYYLPTQITLAAIGRHSGVGLGR